MPAPRSSPFDFWYTNPLSPTQRSRSNPDRERFFARIRSFTLCCPRCAHPTTITPNRNPRVGGLHPNKAARALPRARARERVWDPFRCRWKCPACCLVMTLGIVGWLESRAAPVTPPADTLPTVAEAQALAAADHDWKEGLERAAAAVGESSIERGLAKVREDLHARAAGARGRWEAWGAELFGVLERERGMVQVNRSGRPGGNPAWKDRKARKRLVNQLELVSRKTSR